ncbi:MAG: EAL domain-containing protein [Lachnospiraceae bacterium]|nr:EAL domain-containing protein [Lachnospiraceae bacterium]
MGSLLYFNNYSPVGDVVVCAMCLVILVLLSTSYVSRTKIFGVYLGIVFFLFLGAMADLLTHDLYMRVTNGDYSVVYGALLTYHAVLFMNLLLYVVYIVSVMRIERDKKRPIMACATLLCIACIAIDIVTTVLGIGMRLTVSEDSSEGINFFLFGYAAFMIMIAGLLVAFRKRVFKRVMFGFYGTIAVSFLVLLIQNIHGNNSFTVSSFLFPTVAMLYLVHSNPYDLEIGAISSRGLEDMVSYCYKKGREMIIVSLLLPDFDMDGKTFTKELQETIRRFATEYFTGGVLFQMSNGHMMLVAQENKNPKYKEKMKAMIEAFRVEYDKYHYDYKIVMGTSIEEISRKNEYGRFIKSIQQHMPMNDVHYIKEKDIEIFQEFEYLVSEIADIAKKGDLRDPRVLTYCQPVFNYKTKKYDTAETLMRLNLPRKNGFYYPEQFIPIAEEYGYIHALTKIMLRKTCDEVGKLIREGYDVNRVSINVSILELHDLGFTEDITRIIRNSDVPDNKIAIEITESQTEQDFVVVKNKIDELKDRGIKFYLDDFGTGYSNMERILELPFDIIKFDKSLVTATNANERSAMVVRSLASMFAGLDYSVLYEGVETDGDEKRCVDMSATYLQGYKYSHPIPVEELRNFLTKRTGAR